MSEASLKELISAWVDGELSGDELVQAEQLMADHQEYAELATELRAQREQFQSLPRYELDPDFAERVMASVAGREQVAPRGATASLPAFANGRLAASAIMALAAMLLLVLFVFPTFFDAKPQNTLSKKSGGQVVTDESSDSTDSTDSLSEDQARDSGASDVDGPLARAESQKGQAGIAEAVTDDNLNEGLKNAPGKAQADSGFAGQVAANEAARNSEQDSAMDQRQAVPRRQGVANALAKVPSPLNNSRNLSQVLVIEINNGDLKSVETVLAQNNIQIAMAPADDVEPQPAVNSRQLAGRANESENQLVRPELLKSSDSDIEALYVYSSPAQMSGAISELSRNGQARISAFQMKDVQNYSQLQSSTAGAGMSRMMKQAPPREQAPLQEKSEPVAEQQAVQQAELPQLARQRSATPSGAAQQLNQRMELNSLQMRPPSASGLRGAPSSLKSNAQPGADVQSQSEPQQADGPPTGGVSEDDREKIAKINEWFQLDSELGPAGQMMQQYLLLIKTRPGKSSAEAPDAGSPQPTGDQR